MKSFIETQRALLSEIQNGCKRNFILAKEKEETEQKMKQSASMAEIATEDDTKEEEVEEEPAPNHRDDAAVKEGEEEEDGETTGSAGQTSSQSASIPEASSSQTNLESDSDTEDEEEEEVVTKSCSTSNSSHHSHQTASQSDITDAQPPTSASRSFLSPSASPAGGPSVLSSITVVEAAVSPGTPPSPGRCISVSSPGRGHKIFMVTRVESPPEQQLQQISAPAFSSQTIEASKKPVDTSTQPTLQQTQPTPASQTLLTPAPSTDCELTEPSPVAHLKSTLDTSQSHTTTEDVTPGTLDPTMIDPSQQAPDLPSDPSPVQVVVSHPPDEATESTKSRRSEHRIEGEEESGCITDDRRLMSQDRSEEELNQSQSGVPAVVTQQQLLMPAFEQLQNELASASQDAPPPNQIQKEDKEEKQEAPQTKKGVTEEEEDSHPNQEEPSPKQQTDEQGVESVPSVLTDQQAPSVISNPASAGPEATVEANTDSPVEEEDSDESSADEGRCFAEALDGEVVSSALPNGLKPEFTLHLLDAESTKPGSCVMEHGESFCFR